MAESDPLNPNPAPLPAPTEPTNKRGMVCEFCECRLAANGDIISVGERAKKFRKLEEENERLGADNARIQGELNELRASQPQPAPREQSRKSSGVGMF
jgi:hypothetical protein